MPTSTMRWINRGCIRSIATSRTMQQRGQEEPIANKV